MNCKQCGNPLTGMEAVCPNCGTPVQSEVPVVDPNVQPVVADAAPVMPEAAPVMNGNPMMNPTPVDPNMVNQAVPAMEPAMTPVQETPQEGTKEGSNKKLIIGIVILLVILIGVMIYFVVFAGGGEKTTPTPTPTPVEEEEQEEETPSDIAFGKFNVAFPEGFTATVMGEKFLLIEKDGFSIVFGVDYTNNLDAYLTHFATVHADVYADSFHKLGTHDYLVIREIDSANNGEIAQFVSPGNGVVYTGVLYHKDGETVSQEDLQILDNMITNLVAVETDETTFKEDVGTSGVYDAPNDMSGLNS